MCQAVELIGAGPYIVLYSARGIRMQLRRALMTEGLEAQHYVGKIHLSYENIPFVAEDPYG